MRSLTATILLLCVPACSERDPPAKRAPAAPATHLTASHERMLKALEDVRRRTADSNKWLGDAQARELRPAVAQMPARGLTQDQWWNVFQLGVAELWLGHEQEAVKHLTRAVRAFPEVKPPVPPRWRYIVTFRLGVAYLRLGVANNCCMLSMPDSCRLPIREANRHAAEEGARGAIDRFTEVAKNSPPDSDLHRAALWLLNIAHMYVGAYPDGVPEAFRIPARAFASDEPFPRFENIAGRVGLDAFTLSGGTVADDFDNDGYLDLLISTWETSEQTRFFRNQQDGSFVDRTEEAGLLRIVGGLNMVQGDYDNDGNVDVYVQRGAWMREHGQHPNSLLRNLGGGRFVDVTFLAGLGEAHYPSQTASWADYDNDGDLDLYVGNESGAAIAAPNQLFKNNGDGTFQDVARDAGVTDNRYTKGVIWGDYDGDRLPDLFVSNLDGSNRLYHNDGDGTFTDVAPALGMTGPKRSFPAWFWDFDNDGKLDLYVSAYATDIWHLATVGLGLPVKTELARLWRGDGKGGFRDVASAYNLTRPNAPMGANFGDLDNDGYLDFYLGTGFPSYDTVMPNVMYRSRRGKSFADVSLAGGFAHLQKGHAIVFADLDNDGDQDVFEQMGGALRGDRFYDVLYENPGFDNHWIAIRLVGVWTNRSAIGARLHVVVNEDGESRSIYKHINSGGTFGANSLRQSIGLGKATKIERLEVYWPTTDRTQTFADVPLDCFLRITENRDEYESLPLNRLKLGKPR